MKASVDVSAPVREVFPLVADFSRLTEWDPNVRSVVLLEGEPMAVGARYEVQVRFLGATTSLTYELTELEPDRRVEYRATGSSATTHDQISFAGDETGTRIDFRADVELMGVGRLLRPVIKVVTRGQVDAALQNLQRLFA